MERIQAGDVVMLRSGGLKMTVQWIDGDAAHCVWFDDKMQHHEHTFALVALTKA